LVPQTKTEALPVTKADDLAAIIFTSGSTGPAKGVAFTHLNFDTQVSEIQKRYNIQPGEIDLACFPFFGLFDCLMGVTTVIPDMNTSKPATANPAKLLEQANRRKITQSFASPAVWNKVADYCLQTGKRFETLKRAVSAGAPVSDKILKKLSKVLPVGADIFTPYGATESLPVASISYRERTAARSENKGNIGVCVGKRFDTIQWKIIKITDEPITHLESDNTNFIGELCVSGPQVTKEYVNRPEANAVSKITDKDGNVWHRIGDTGYIDEQDRFWFCGRKAHRVETPDGTLFSIPCEAVFNQHPNVYRSALAKQQSAASARIFIEPYIFPNTPKERDKLLAELRQLASANPLTKTVSDIRILKSFPVDVRHNIKINRELLSTLR
ncbi:MAG: AMP-binding protein, partial [Planctomycetaceae bacterium]|nr:AMP-binding protein [Planctomycetaceae bacterium]